MFRIQWGMSVLVVSLIFAPLSGFAAEHGGQEHGGATSAPAAEESGDEAAASVSAPVESVPATPAPEVAPAAPSAPAEPPPVLKPITITFSGDASEINAGATPAVITVQDRYGVKKQIDVPSDAKIAQGTNAKALSDLKTGDKLTVEYTYEVATGKRTAKSITVGEAAAATP